MHCNLFFSLIEQILAWYSLIHSTTERMESTTVQLDSLVLTLQGTVFGPTSNQQATATNKGTDAIFPCSIRGDNHMRCDTMVLKSRQNTSGPKTRMDVSTTSTYILYILTYVHTYFYFLKVCTYGRQIDRLFLVTTCTYGTYVSLK